MSRKYVICPGFVRSKNDGDRHFINARKLMELYGVKNDEAVFPADGKDYPCDWPRLRPDCSGKYERPPLWKHFFIPLNAEHFDAFEAGTKQDMEERRPTVTKTGKPSHWSKAQVGDTVTLSYGYGKRRRLTGRVVSVRFTRDLDSLIGWRECYGTRFDEAVCIGIAIDAKVKSGYCDACKYLTPTEAEQDASPVRPRVPHRCTKHGIVLKHLGQHPRIPNPEACEGPFGYTPPVPGMKTRPMGLPMMAGAWLGLINFCAGEAECLTEFKKTTGHDLTSVLRARGIDKMIDRATGHDLEVVAAFCDFVTRHAWGEEKGGAA